MTEASADGATGADQPPGAWVVWNAETGGPVTWVFRPETFDAEAFRAQCIPTIHVSNRQGDRRPPSRTGRAWRSRLTLEPDVEVDRSGTCPTRQAALDRARSFARTFLRGEYELRGAYHDPADRDGYLSTVERLTAGGNDGT